MNIKNLPGSSSITDTQTLRRNNEQAHVNRLPAELLSRIFAYQLRRPGEFSKLSANEFAFSRVSHWWRQVALGNPLLWCAPTFKCPPWGAEMVRRSKGAPLRIYEVMAPPELQQDKSRWSEQDVEKALAGSLGHLPSICQLRLSCPTHVLQRLVSHMPLAPAPLLEDLALCGSVLDDCAREAEDEDNVVLPSQPFQGVFPKLRVLKLNKCSVAWESPLLATGLTRLGIGMLPAAERQNLTWSRMLDVLTQMPALQELSLVHALPTTIDEAPPQPTHTLHSLSRLTLFDTMLPSSHFLSRIEPRSLIYLDVSTEDYCVRDAPMDEMEVKAGVLLTSFIAFLVRTGLASAMGALQLDVRQGECDDWDIFTLVGSRGLLDIAGQRLFSLCITHAQDISDSWSAFCAASASACWMSRVHALAVEGRWLRLKAPDWVRIFGSLLAVREVRCSNGTFEGFLEAYSDSRRKALADNRPPAFFPEVRALALREADFRTDEPSMRHQYPPGPALLSIMRDAYKCKMMFDRLVLERCSNLKELDLKQLSVVVGRLYWDGYDGAIDMLEM